MKNVDANSKFCFQREFYIILVSKIMNLHVSVANGYSYLSSVIFAWKTEKRAKSDDFDAFADRRVE